MMRIRLLAMLIAIGATCASSAWAAYPDRPIRYVLHVSPGGATDVMARKLGGELQKEMGVPIVVENRPGGRGASEMAEITRAQPDGYTIGAVTSTHLSEFHQTLRRYNVDSVAWIARLASEPYLFVVRADSPIHSMKDLASAIAADPGKMVIAGFVRGSGANIAWEMFVNSAHLQSQSVNWVPYDSVGGGVTAVLGGHATATVAYYGLVRDQVAAGNLRVIGVMTAKRMNELPDVPTLAEQGFDVPTDWTQWRGIIAPKGMPQEVTDKLAIAIQKVMEGPEMKKFLAAESLVYDFAGPAAFTAFAKAQDQLTLDWLKRLGFIQQVTQ
jgi:tripartite-type tricarboxylate transporter receptor subunit TctC